MRIILSCHLNTSIPEKQKKKSRNPHEITKLIQATRILEEEFP